MIRTKSWCEAGLRTIGWIGVRLRAHPGRTADALRKDGCEDPGGDRCGGPAGRFAPARLRQSVAGPCRTCLALLSALGPRLQHRRRPAGPAETLRLARSGDFRRDNAVLSLRNGSAASHLLLRGSYDPDRDWRIEGSIQAICRQGRRRSSCCSTGWRRCWSCAILGESPGFQRSVEDFIRRATTHLRTQACAHTLCHRGLSRISCFPRLVRGAG